MTVTKTERSRAEALASETALVEERGARALANAIARVKPAYKRALRSRQSVQNLITIMLFKSKKSLVRAMMESWLLGMKHSVKTSAIALSDMSAAANYLAKMFNLTDEQIAAHEARFDSVLTDILFATGSRADEKIQRAMRESIELGEHVGPALERLDNAFTASGLTPENAYQLETIFRTQCQIAYSGARWNANKKGLIADMLWGYKYVTVGDDRVRPEHDKLDGVTLPVDDPRWDTIFPPNGWNCRCQPIELFEEEAIVEPPAGYMPDKGFAFNPGQVFGDYVLKPQSISLANTDADGQWITVNGRHVFIPEGGDKDAIVKALFKQELKPPSFKPDSFYYDYVPKATQMEVNNSPINHLVKSAKTNVAFLNKLPVKDATGLYNHKTGQVLVGGAYFQSLKDTTKLTLGKSWVVDKSKAGTIRHELGHAVYNRVLSKKLKSQISQFAWDDAYNKKPSLSKYAQTSEADFAAEFICAITHPEFKLSSFPAKWRGTAKEILKGTKSK